jgi:hypothetical protein
MGEIVSAASRTALNRPLDAKVLGLVHRLIDNFPICKLETRVEMRKKVPYISVFQFGIICI